MPDGISAPPVPPATAANGAAAASGQPKVPGARSDSEARIKELAAQKAHYQQKWNAAAGELSEVKERLARLEGRSEAQPAATAGTVPKSWDAMSDAQLDEAVTWAQENGNPAALNQAINEKVRRGIARGTSEAVAQSQQVFERQQHATEIRARIVEDFGQEALNQDSDLYRAADRHMASYLQRYGKDAVKNSPDFLYDAFLRAEREVRVAREREDYKRLQDEHDALKRHASLLERGNGVAGGAPPSDEVAEALKRGDVKGAIRATGLVRGLAADAKRRYGGA